MVKKLLVFLVLFSLGCAYAIGQPKVLSTSAEISILTCGPGASLSSKFGHTGLEVIDPELNLHEVYNFGTFNFDTPFFYVKYLKGSLLYYLSINSYQKFLDRYKGEDRTIYKQVLELDSISAQKIYDLLQEADLPENKYYTYDFIRRNCTTKTKDVIDGAISHKVQYDTSFVDQNKTFRSYLNTHLVPGTLITVGINLIFGNKTDQVPPFSEYSFLPDMYFEALNHATIDGKPLVKRTETIHTRTVKQDASMKRTLTVWGVVLIFLLITVWEYYQKLNFRTLDILLFSISGLLSLILIFMWGFSSHDPTANNPDLLWLTPLHFIFVWKLKNIRFSFYYALVFVLVILAMLAYYLLIDFQDMGVFALLLILLMRMANRGWTAFEFFRN